MNKGFALIIATGVVFLVMAVAEEGGPLDTFTNGESAGAEGAQVARAERPANASRVSAPAPFTTEEDSGIGDWADESEIVPPPAPVSPRRSTNRSSSNEPETGAIDRSRMNIEE